MKVAWKAGWNMAQSEAVKVGRKDTLVKCGKWEKPWPSSFRSTLAIVEKSCAIEVDDDSIDPTIPLVSSSSSLSQSENSKICEISALIQSLALSIDQQDNLSFQEPNQSSTNSSVVSKNKNKINHQQGNVKNLL
jgi:hypothetical protein